MAAEEISPDFPFKKKRVNTLDSFMAYVDTGHPSTAATTTVVFVHGNPTSSYLWRNVIPHVSPVARCVAPDLVGFGDSGKMPSGGYYIKEHIEYFAAFMEAVVPANEKVVFVIHDWGSGLGFDWARKNEERMAGLVCMEFIHMMVTTEDFVGWERNLTKMRDPETGHQCVIEENYFVEVILREEGTSKGSLPDAVMEHYRRPFAHPADREPQWRMPNEIPLEGRAPEVGEILYKAWNWLKEGNNQVPKLLFSVNPGMLLPPHKVKDVAEWMGNPPVVRLGNSGHFPQEEYPHRIGEETRRFVDNLLVGK